jgi:hypothetical protein
MVTTTVNQTRGRPEDKTDVHVHRWPQDEDRRDPRFSEVDLGDVWEMINQRLHGE